MRSQLAQETRRRITFLGICLAVIGLVLTVRVGYWQLRGVTFVDPTQSLVLQPLRGSIVDANGRYLVANSVIYTVGISPHLLREDDREGYLRLLTEVLGMEAREAGTVLDSRQPYVQLGTEVPSATVDELLRRCDEDQYLTASVFRLDPRQQRVYADPRLMASVLGMVLSDGEAAYGIEQQYDAALRGQEGQWASLIDETGQAVLAEWGEYRSPRDGAQVVLTIDRNVQLEAERLLTEALDTYEALRGNILVLDPRTGAVLAMANLPGVNLETLEELQTGDFWRVANTAASAIYEPGSVIKPITLAAALETRSVLPTDTYDDRGEMWVGGRRVANMGDVPYGQLNWTQMLARSANVGAAHLAATMGPARFYEMLRRFGFGDVTGVDLPLEAQGLMRVPNMDTWHMSDLATNSYGQGISMTPLQVAVAYAALANDGVMMRPHLVAEVRWPDGVQRREPAVLRRVLSPQVADQVGEIMAEAMELGMENAMVAGYRFAGKSGTAGVPRDGEYDHRLATPSFVGFGPLPEPRFVILVKLEEVVGDALGLEVAAPIFREMATYLLDYYRVPASQPLAEAG
ncbi:MAG: peptidoglycan D,D-transpeptidase FtsI family protein [Anaerolineae bacterium]